MWFIKGFFVNLAKILVAFIMLINFCFGAVALGVAFYGYTANEMPVAIWATIAFAVSIAIFTLIQKAREALHNV